LPRTADEFRIVSKYVAPKGQGPPPDFKVMIAVELAWLEINLERLKTSYPFKSMRGVTAWPSKMQDSMMLLDSMSAPVTDVDFDDDECLG
jgi:hypothetical protein